MGAGGLKKHLRRYPRAYAALKRTKASIVQHRPRHVLKPGEYVRFIQAQLQYFQVHELAHKGVKRDPGTIIAVVVHLYYPEVWPIIDKQLSALHGRSFDIFITFPSQNRAFARNIEQTYSHHGRIYAYEMPNWGRDVLPFMRLAPLLLDKGYAYVLKLHTKRSPHRTDGSDWMTRIVSSLVPDEDRTVDELFEVLADPRTGLIGPAGEYYSMGVNFEANGPHLTKLLNKLYAPDVSHSILQTNRTTHGFFGGTMFWARLEALAPIFTQRMSLLGYEPERSQIDATRAHAMERVFSLVQQIEKRKLYEIDRSGVREVVYDSGQVPDWSHIYIGPKE